MSNIDGRCFYRAMLCIARIVLSQDVPLSVRLSVTRRFLSKRLNVSLNFFHRRVFISNGMAIFRRDPPTRRRMDGVTGVLKNRDFSANISLYLVNDTR